MSFFKKLLATLIPASRPAPQNTESAHPEPDHTEIPPNFPDPYVTPEVTYDSFERIKQGVKAKEARAFHLMGLCYENGENVERDINTAFDCYLKGARLGDPFAQNAVGFFYHTGLSKVRYDSRKAVHWTLKAAEQGLASAQYSIGLMYERGDGSDIHPVLRHAPTFYTHLKKDDKAAMSWYRRAAAQGHVQAMGCIGLFYLYGSGVQQDLKEARYWLEKAVSAGNPEPFRYFPMLEAAERRAAGEEPPPIDTEAPRRLKEKAEKGDAEAQFQLACQIFDNAGSSGCAFKEGLPWLKKAVEQNHPQAAYVLGSIYYKGVFMLPRKEEGWTLLMQAANADNPDALERLGYICEFEKKQLPEALKWYQASAALECPGAIFALARWYRQGIEVEQDEDKAFQLLSRAAEMGLPEAQCEMAVCHYEGIHVPQDSTQAVAWLTKAAEYGFPRAQWMLAIHYANGDGVERNTVKAYHCLWQAAESGDAESQYRLAEFLIAWSSSAASYAEAVAWLRKSLIQDYAPAEFMLGRFYEEGSGVKQDKAMAQRLIASAAEKGYEEAIAYLAQQGGESPSPL